MVRGQICTDPKDNDSKFEISWEYKLFYDRIHCDFTGSYIKKIVKQCSYNCAIIYSCEIGPCVYLIMDLHDIIMICTGTACINLFPWGL